MDKTRRENAQKVVIAMSGGVDSSVATALLKRAGFDVIGIFMKFWSPSDGGKTENRCCSTESETRARKVAKIIGIPLYVLNFKKEFKKRIVDYFLKEHKNGTTPNPCVICNKEIKFGLLMEKALSLNVDFIATGHYARIKKIGATYNLYKGKDKEKDQSYFLWQLNQKQLKHVLLPIGNYTRKEVENMAEKLKLPFARVKKSMEICFIPDSVGNFLKKYIKSNPGKIINKDGKTIGKHDGLWFYTIGQRKGIKLSGGLYYVLAKDLKKNYLIITRKEKDLYKKELTAKNINWISGQAPRLPLKIAVKIRYRHKAAQAIINHSKRLNVYNLKFKFAQRAITPGQSVVFYSGQKLLGGGIII